MSRNQLSSLRYAGTVALALCAALSTPQRSKAASAFANPAGGLTRFIWTTVTMQAGTTYTIETRNRTNGSDPFMHLINPSNVQVAFDDDGAGNLNSRIVYTAPTSGSYRVWVRGYSNTSSGNADLFVNNTSWLTQSQFGGYHSILSWNAGQEFRATGTQRDSGNDTLLFLVGTGGSTYMQHDDDSGPANYSYLTASAGQSSGRAYMGLYPGSTGDAHLIMSDVVINSGGGDNDADNDTVADSLEAAAGMSTASNDGDNDGIPDVFELTGNEGWSMSENATPDTHFNPTMRNIYVEADWMPASGAAGDANKQPYAAMAADVATLFRNQTAGFAAGQRVSIDVRRSNQVPYTQQIKIYDAACTTGDTTCVHFNTLKATHFRPGDGMYRIFAHYVVFANMLGDSDLGGCTSGRAEFLGNDLVVTLPQRDAAGNACPWTPTQVEQRGTFVHELGHNLNLTHNNNDWPDNNFNSNVHASVMNYRWQVNNAPGAPVNAAHLSHGGGGCAPCTTSPQWICVISNSLGLCPSSPTCDCDVNEWGSLNVDFFEGSSFSDGSAGGSPAVWPVGETPAAAVARRRSGNEKDLQSFTETRPLPQEAGAHRRARVEKRVEALKARGLEQNKHFVRSADGEHIYSVCK